MKFIFTIITAMLLTININLLNAQSSTTIQQYATDGWEVSENWMQAYRENVSATGSLTWINDLIADGAQMMTHKNENGIILIIEEDNEDEMSLEELAEMEYIGMNGTRFFPIEAAEFSPNYGASAELQGQLGGEQILMQKVCIPAPGQDHVLSILSIVPANGNTKSTMIQNFDSGQLIASQLFNQSDINVTQAD